VPEGEGKEIYVAASLCKVVWAEVVNRVSDVDKEAWDVLENAPPQGEKSTNGGGSAKKRKHVEGKGGKASSGSSKQAKPAPPPALRKQPNIPSGIPGLWNKVVTVDGRPGHWFVMNYDQEAEECRLGSMAAVGVFGERSGSRVGRPRWKVLTESGALLEEIEVEAGQCNIIKAECVNKTADVEREAWDLESKDPPKKHKAKKPKTEPQPTAAGQSKAQAPQPPPSKKADKKKARGEVASAPNKRVKTAAPQQAAATVQVTSPDPGHFVVEARRSSRTNKGDDSGFVLMASEKSKQKGKGAPPPPVKVKDGKGMLQKTIDYFFAAGQNGEDGDHDDDEDEEE